MDRFMDYVAALADLLWRRRLLTAGITWAVLALLFYMEVIFPPVKPSLSSQPITLNSQDYPNLRAQILTLPAGSLSGYRQKSPASRKVIDIEYVDHGIEKTLYRCLCRGYICAIHQLENGEVFEPTKQKIEFKWISVQEIKFKNLHGKTKYCAISQAEFLQKYTSKTQQITYIDGTIIKPIIYSLNEDTLFAINYNFSSPEIQEFSSRIYFISFLLTIGFILGMYFLAWLVKK